jgi:hypothetical protein
VPRVDPAERAQLALDLGRCQLVGAGEEVPVLRVVERGSRVQVRSAQRRQQIERGDPLALSELEQPPLHLVVGLDQTEHLRLGLDLDLLRNQHQQELHAVRAAQRLYLADQRVLDLPGVGALGLLEPRALLERLPELDLQPEAHALEAVAREAIRIAVA